MNDSTEVMHTLAVYGYPAGANQIESIRRHRAPVLRQNKNAKALLDEPLAGAFQAGDTRGVMARAKDQGKQIGRPKGSKDKRQRKRSGHFRRWGH